MTLEDLGCLIGNSNINETKPLYTIVDALLSHVSSLTYQVEQLRTKVEALESEKQDRPYDPKERA